MRAILVSSCCAGFLLSGVAAQPTAADRSSDDKCSQLTTTLDIEQCHGEQAKQWDRRLNAAYQALLQRRADPGQREPLKAAQRLWMRYRDANCGFYAAGEGTISRVLAADCVRTMTQQRACELEAAGNPESGAAPGCRP